MNTTAQAIAAAEARHVVKVEDALEDRLKATMKATRGHWMATDEDDQLYAAIGAVYALASEEEKKQITNELEHLKILSALLSGVPVDFEAIPPLANPIGIMKLWQDTKPF